MSLPPPLIALAAWFVPGLGHILLGRTAKGLYMGGLILAAFGIGLLLGQGYSVASVKFPYHWWGQVCAGAPALLANRFLGLRAQDHTIDRLELGVVFTTVAGIMNVVAIVDAYTIARTRGATATPGGKRA
ncbi:MAG TPA: DUF6677 family protein [Planctomycetota bacterium]|nr:DUF6677 family protein [Planctomycetota bacterium]